MKFRPSFLFYIIAVLSLGLIPLTNNKTLDLNVHDTYFVLTYFHYIVAIFILSVLTGLIYSLMNKIKKPITTKTAIVHFVFIVFGLILSVNFYGIIVMSILTGVIPDPAAFAFDKTAFIVFLLGPTLLLFGLLVFIYGLIKAITRKTNAY